MSPTRMARDQLLQYFAGVRQFFDLPLSPVGTDFQRKTWSYAELAGKIAAPEAVRAVGKANARRPLPIILPCHRVIGSNGSLTGFGGGFATNKWLLDHEGAPVQCMIEFSQKNHSPER